MAARHAPPPRFSLVRVLAVLCACLCVLGVLAIVAVQAVRVTALERAQRVADQLGVKLHLGDVIAGWDASAEVRGASLSVVTGDPTGVLHARAQRIHAQWRLGDLVSGRRRPAQLRVDGAQVEVRARSLGELKRWIDPVLRRWRERPRAEGGGEGAQAGAGLEVDATDVSLQLAIGGVHVEARADEARWFRLPAGEYGLTAQGAAIALGQRVAVSLSGRVRFGAEPSWALRATLEPPLEWATRRGDASIAASLSGLELNSAGALELFEAKVALVPSADELPAAVAVQRARIEWDHWPAGVAELRWPRELQAEGVAIRRGALAVDVELVGVTLSADPIPDGARSATALAASLVANVTAARAHGVAGQDDDRQVRGAVEVVDVVLHPGDEELGARLRSVYVTAPRLELARGLVARGEVEGGDEGALEGDNLDGPELDGPAVDEEDERDPPRRGGKAARRRAALARPPPDAVPGPAQEAGDGGAGAGAAAHAASRVRARWAERLAPLWALRHVVVEVRQGAVSVRGDREDEVVKLRGLDLTWVPAREGRAPRLEAAARLQEGAEGGAAMKMSASISPDGELRSLRLGTSGRRLAQLLPELSSHLLARPDAELSLDLRVDRTEGDAFRVTAGLVASEVGFHWWRIAHAPVDDLDLELELDGVYDPGTDHLRVQMPSLRVGRTKLRGELEMARVTGVPDLRLRLVLPRQPCEAVFDSIPKALVPRLTNLRAAGTFAFDLSLAVDLEQPKGLKLDLDGELDTCRVVDMGTHVDFRALSSRRFVHRPVVDGEELDVRVGPGTRHWTPLEEIPSYVAWAAIATEDLDFYVHNGFKLSLIKRALKLDLDRKRYVYGGSTISQQLVKNLFLSREKTMARKLEEAVITWQMEHTISKHRILELYLNCIEYGPDIYGLQMAARHYFGKQPSELTPLEGAFLMGNKPCPKCGYRQWAKGGLDARWQKRMVHIMKRLRDRGWITRDQYDAEEPFLPTFYYAGRGQVVPRGVRPNHASWRP